MSERPRLLFLSPVMPASSGNGLAMRAGLLLQAYARRFDVALVVLPVVDPGRPSIPTELALACASRVDPLPLPAMLHPHYRLILGLRDPIERRAAVARYPLPWLCSYDAAAVGDALKARLQGWRFSTIHVERLYLAPLVDHTPAARRLIIDLDEDDHASHLAIGRLQEQNADSAAAAASFAQARKFAALQRDWLPRFDLLLVAGAAEARAIAAGNQTAQISVVPNGYHAGLSPEPRSMPERSIDFLMVGNLDFYPNVDAARFFCGSVLPLIDARRSGSSVVLAGAGPNQAVQALARQPNVAIRADPLDMAPLYADAAVAIAPLRAGGGSRIKILEAFALGVPVVATGVGAAGLDVVDGRHLLIADTAEDFAAAAVRLREDHALAASIAAQARALLERTYAGERVAAALLALVDELDAPPTRT